VWFPLSGALPAGAYRVQVQGIQDAGASDGRLHADVIYRHPGSADQILGGADSRGVVDGDAGIYAPSDIDGSFSAAAVPGAMGDLLVVSVKMTAGATGFLELSTSLTIP
jgi:hypothetical protein